MTTKILLVALGFGAFALKAQNPQKAHSAEVTSAGAGEELSVLAGKMIDETNRARLAIKNGNKQAAIQHVDRAITDLQRINSRANGSTLIPLYQEFVSVSILTPVEAEHQARSEARAASADNSTKKNPAVVHEVAGVYRDVLVSTKVAENSLSAAKQALSMNDMKTADEALADVQEGIKIEETKGDIPVAEVRENLVLARAAIRNHNYQQAEAALKKAAGALNGVIEANDPHSQDARILQQQISSYAQNLQQNHSDTEAKINAWWNETANWTPYKSQQELK